jgi:hypothetical protein
MQQMADGGNEEGCGNLVLVEQPQNAGHAVHGAVFAARDAFRDQVARREVCGRVVDVEAQPDRDGRSRPRDCPVQRVLDCVLLIATTTARVTQTPTPPLSTQSPHSAIQQIVLSRNDSSKIP